MKRRIALICSIMLLILLAACNSGGQNPPSTQAPVPSASSGTEYKGQTTADRQIQITAEDGAAIVFMLNGSTAAQGFYAQLPLSVRVENYSNNEKIVYPPKKLDTSGTPLAKGPAGTLAYYAPWGDVVMFYGDTDGAAGLYQLGTAVSGTEHIAGLAGEIRIEAAAVVPISMN